MIKTRRQEPVRFKRTYEIKWKQKPLKRSSVKIF